MAEYIKFRLTAAKIGVSMALLALIAGVTERAQAKPSQASASPAASVSLKLAGLSGVLRSDLKKLDRAFVKIDTALTSFEHKVNTTFLKMTSANAEFLKIDSANAEYLKITPADSTFLKITDANNEFLKIRGTAVNSGELGGLTPDAFFQGHGNVVSGAVTISPGGSPQTLLTLPGGVIVVSAVANSDGVTITIDNDTGALIPAVQDGDTTPITIAPGQGHPLSALINNAQAHQIHVQLLPNSSFSDVVTLVISSEPSVTGSGIEVAGQAFAGAI